MRKLTKEEILHIKFNVQDKHITASHRQLVYECMEEYLEQETKELKLFCKLIKSNFPDSVLRDQMGEDYGKIEKLLK